jgi:hypothetical protein
VGIFDFIRSDTDNRFVMADAPNDAAIAVTTAIAALIAILPLKCLADVREQGAEVAFYVGGRLG